LTSDSNTVAQRGSEDARSRDSIRFPYRPDYRQRPGKVLDEILNKREMSARELARRCGRSAKLIVEIISGKAPIEPETALQFEKVLGVDASVWLSIESAYRLHRAKANEEQSLANHIGWAKRFHLEELYRLGVLEKLSDPAATVKQLLQFFGAGSVEACQLRFKELADGAYRHSPSFVSSEESLLVWLRLGEQKAEEIACHEYDRSGFMEVLREIRELSVRSPEKFLPKIETLCAGAGVAFVIQRPIGKIALSGVSRWLTPRKALIQQTLRHKKNDHFWFTFFHEAAHLLLHSRKSVFIEGEGDERTGKREEEQEADDWSSNFLIPTKAMEQFILEGCFSEQDILNFAMEQRIAPGVIVGQLQKRQAINWASKLNHLKEAVDFPDE